MRLRHCGALALTAYACATVPRSASEPPPVPREFRAVWVATVANIDWPSRRALPAEQQRQELVAILDRAKEVGVNVVILQVRPAADALYRSLLEPWSAHLTGRMGAPPEPEYDPLAYAVDAAHSRGLELHAWFNPYRARVPSDTGSADSMHISLQRPDLVRRYGSFLWMDPGEPEVLQHTRAVILDVTRRYDIDAIHIDDYFYPYPERDSAGAPIAFPDEASYARYVAAGGRLSLADWRRENVDRLVAELYFSLQQVKPWVRFGVSPIGSWRPGHPDGTRGYDAYEQIYADARKWWRNGWLDYFTPQLYWRVNNPAVPWAPMLRWWSDENERQRQLVPGLFTSRADTVDEGNRWRAAEIIEQIRLARAEPGAAGHIHFSARALMRNQDSIADRLRQVYATPALVPTPRNASGPRPPAPLVSFERVPGHRSHVLLLAAGDTAPVWLWTVRSRTGRHWTAEILPGATQRHSLGRADEVIVTAVDRLSRESAVVRLRVPR